MSHLAATAINKWLSGSGAASATQPVLDASNGAIINSALTADACGIYYSAVLTVADALTGIARGYFSWGTVKLYYAAFYSARVLLAANDVAIFYPGTTKPHSLLVVPGQCAKKEQGVTHKVVWDVLKRQLSASPLLGEVENQPAHRWLMDLREEVNYRTPKFPDPLVPKHFSYLDKIGLEKAVKAYMEDKSFLFCFDPDHAALAFPLECLRSAGAALKRQGFCLEDSDIDYVSACLAAVGADPRALLAVS